MKVSMQAFVGALVLCAVAVSAQAGEMSGIVWRGQTFPAFKAAMEQKVPLVVYFYGEDGGGKLSWSKKLEEGPLAGPELAEYASKASFVKVDTNLDDTGGNVKKLVQSLGIKTVPTISVLHCRPDKIEEVGQIVGYYETAVFMEKFQALHAQAVERIAKDQPAQPPTLSAAEEAALAVRLIGSLQTEANNSDIVEKKHLACYQMLLRGETLDAVQFTATHRDVQNQLDVILSVVDQIGTLSSPEAKAAASAMRAAISRTRAVYEQHHRELSELVARTGLKDFAPRAQANDIATRFQKNLADSLAEMDRDARTPVQNFVKRYAVN